MESNTEIYVNAVNKVLKGEKMEEKEIKTIVINLPKDLYDKYSHFCAWEERDINKQTRKLIKEFIEKKASEEYEVDQILGIDNK
jgi:hypothetical protein